MSKHVMPDTDVLIDFLRGYPEAVAWIEANADHLVVSSVVVAELYAGVRGDARSEEQVALAELLTNVKVVPISEEIARLGGLYKRDFGKSHGVGLADAIIAASAKIEDADLGTLNTKHYPMLDAIEPAYSKVASLG